MPGGGNCLVRAMTGRALLARQGLESDLVLGVAKEPGGALRGHAWLNYRGTPVIGGNSAECYAQMPSGRSRRCTG